MAAQTMTPEAQALATRAVQLQASGQYPEAADAYTELLKSSPNDVAAHVNLGVVLVNLGRYDDALAQYDAADKLLPGDPRIQLNKALAYEKSGRLTAAEPIFSHLHQANASEAKYTVLLADCENQLERYEQVIALLQPIADQSSADPSVAYMLGTALLHVGKTDEGQRVLDPILRNANTPESHFLIGVKMFESGDFPSAVQELRSAADLKPDFPQLQSFLGRALLNTGDPDAAAAAFRAELKSNPNDYWSNLRLGQILTVRRQLPEARNFIEHAAQLRPDQAEPGTALSELRAAEKGANPVHRGGTQEGGPQVNDVAPAFALHEQGTGRLVRLQQFRGKSPVLLIFGSYSCPNFRSAAKALRDSKEQHAKVPFLLVYIREAHATGQWQSTRNEREGVNLRPAENLTEKEEHARMCSRSLHLSFPAVVDGMDDAVERAYDAWPSRAVLVGEDGRVLYNSRLSELDFQPEELNGALERSVASPAKASLARP
jgi:Flp pilus assembly protein TadD